MLKTKGFFLLTKAIRKMEIIKELKKMVTDVTGLTDEEKNKAKTGIGIEFMGCIIENVEKAESEIIEFIANYKGISVEEAEQTDFILIINQVLKDEDIISFFKQAMLK